MNECPKRVESPSFGANFMEKGPRTSSKGLDFVENPSLGLNFMEKCRNSPNFCPKSPENAEFWADKGVHSSFESKVTPKKGKEDLKVGQKGAKVRDFWSFGVANMKKAPEKVNLTRK